jgi:hypothetical protein
MIPIDKNTAGIFTRRFGTIEEAGHTHFQSGTGGARQVIDHHAFTRIGFIGEFLCDGKGFGIRFAVGPHSVDVDDGFKELIQFQNSENAPGGVNVCIGKDQFPLWQRSDVVFLN